jgi:hypothetical protein
MTGYQIGTVFGAFVGPLLVFGALLFVIKRGKLTFYEAVQNRWVVGFTVLTVLANMANGFSPAPKPRVFNSDNELATFRTGCIEGGLPRMDRTKADTACACIVSQIESTLTRENFMMMMSTAAKTGVASPEMEAIAAKCEPAQK